MTSSSSHIITEHEFNQTYINKASFSDRDYNRPIVYLILWDRHAYVWESSNVFRRMKDHLKNKERVNLLKKMLFIYDIEYNKSATLDIESQLIQYMAWEGSLILQNRNDGLRNHHYYDREKYLAKFEVLRRELQAMNIVNKNLNEIRNSDLFKYSPYKSLNEDQYEVVSDIYEQIVSGRIWTFVINWEPWTWKSIVASYMIKFLKSKKETKDLNIALVVPMAWLRDTFKKVFSNIEWLKPSMVIGPNELAKNYSENNKIPYDIVIVDETHRLQKRKSITNYKAFDDVNKKLGLPVDATQLDRVLGLSHTQILLYDKNQSVRPADVNSNDFARIWNVQHYELKSQMRVQWWNEYLTFINNLFEWWEANFDDIKNYDFRLFEDFRTFRNAIFEKDKQFWLSRIVAWYAWPRKSKGNPNEYDIEIEWIKMFRNSTNINWVNSANALQEIWCIHTIQWYDLNYVGVIFWEELSYDKTTGEFVIRKNKYHDTKGKLWVDDEYELKRYIINIYKTLLTRGILWTYVYVVDKDLREYLQSRIT